jgi:Cys-tRNA(Pro) deacylase
VARKEKLPSTPALRLLRKEGVDFEVCRYDYVDKGGTRASSESLGVEEHAVVKTLIFEDENKKPLVMLMHGDMTVSAKELARIIGAKRLAPCDPKTADKHSGYRVGGTSPFGTRTAMPDGGARGLLVRIRPTDLIRLLDPKLVKVGLHS